MLGILSCCKPGGDGSAPPALAHAGQPRGDAPALPPEEEEEVLDEGVEPGRVLLFYRYCDVPSPAGLVASQTELCAAGRKI